MVSNPRRRRGGGQCRAQPRPERERMSTEPPLPRRRYPCARRRPHRRGGRGRPRPRPGPCSTRRGGGQPATAATRCGGGSEIAILDTVYDPTRARSCIASRRHRSAGAGERVRLVSTGRCATPACGCTPPCTCSRRSSLSGHRRFDRRRRGPARFRHPGCRPRQGGGDGALAGDDRAGCRRDDALDQRRGASGQSRPRQDDVGEAADGQRPVRLVAIEGLDLHPAAAPM